MSLGKCFYRYTLYYSNACIFFHFLASELENLQERNSGWKILEPLSTALASRAPFGDRPLGLPPFLQPQNGLIERSCVVCEGLTKVSALLLSCTFLQAVASPIPFSPWKMGSLHPTIFYFSQRQINSRAEKYHANSKYGSEVKTIQDFKDKVKHRNWIGLLRKHCFFLILLHSFWSFCNKIFIQDFFPHCDVPLHHP